MCGAINADALRTIVLLGSVLFMNACASLYPQQQTGPAVLDNGPILTKEQRTAEQQDETTTQGWWRVGFHRQYENDDDIMWHLDALLANEVFRPLIAEHQQDLTLWRFHRRAGADSAGHKFSFIFYSTRNTAAVIYRAINHQELVKALLTNNTIERVSFSDLEDKPESAIEATSDDVWQVELQKAWPHFIMGVSRTWLELISQFADQAVSESPEASKQDIAEKVDFYEKIHNHVNNVWKEQGGHAFLHHLNALFGYQELYIIERRQTRF